MVDAGPQLSSLCHAQFSLFPAPLSSLLYSVFLSESGAVSSTACQAWKVGRLTRRQSQTANPLTKHCCASTPPEGKNEARATPSAAACVRLAAPVFYQLQDVWRQGTSTGNPRSREQSPSSSQPPTCGQRRSFFVFSCVCTPELQWQLHGVLRVWFGDFSWKRQNNEK